MTRPRILTAWEDMPRQWCAWLDGDEESGLRGWGKTEAEAVEELEAFLEDVGRQNDGDGVYAK